MPTHVEVPGLGTVEFPDEMPPEHIQAALQKLHSPSATSSLSEAVGKVGGVDANAQQQAALRLRHAKLPNGSTTQGGPPLHVPFDVGTDPLLKVEPPQSEVDFARKQGGVAATAMGVRQGIDETIQGLTTPRSIAEMIGTLGMGRLANLYFGARGAEQAGQAFGTAAGTPDSQAKPGEKAKLITEGLAGTAMAALPLAHEAGAMAKPKPIYVNGAVSPEMLQRLRAKQATGQTMDELNKEANPSVKGIPAKLATPEKDLQGQEMVLTGPWLARNAKAELGFEPSATTPEQTYNRLKNLTTTGKFSQAELSVYDEAGLKDFLKTKPSGEVLAKWMQENGPRVEVKKFGEASETQQVRLARQRMAQIEHDFDTQKPPLHLQNTRNHGVLIKDEKGNAITGDKLPLELQEKFKEYAGHANIAEYKSERASAHWQSIAPKAERDMPGYVEIAVTKNPKLTPIDRKTFRLSPTQDGENIKFPSSHSFPPNTLGFVRGYMEKAPDGKKVFHVIEVQSDWAQQQREYHEVVKANQRVGMTRGIADYEDKSDSEDPLLRDYERLALKAAINHAKSEGADAIAVSDAETAMMTEGHDRGGMHETSERERGTITQESGMRLHYDQILPKLLKELTGQEGAKQSFGEHKMAFDTKYGSGEEVENQADPANYLKRQRPDLIFKNESGQPKTDVSARVYDLSKVKQREAFSLFDKDKAATEQVKGVPPKDSSVDDKAQALGLNEGKPTSMGDVLRKLGANEATFGKENSALARFLVDQFPHILDVAGVENGKAPSLGRAGYDPTQHKVFLDLDSNDGWETHLKTLHEGAHAAVHWLYDSPRTASQREARSSIDQLVDTARKALPSRVREFFQKEYEPYLLKHYENLSYDGLEKLFRDAGIKMETWNEPLYALSDGHEFIASTFHSPEFRSFLNGVEFKGGNAFERAWSFMKQLVGIKAGTVLEKTFDSVSKFAQEDEAMKGEQREVNDARTKGIIPFGPSIDKLKAAVKSLDTKERISQLMDAAENEANIGARQAANWLRSDVKDGLDRKAITFIIEAKGDKNALQNFKTQIGNNHPEAVSAIDRAIQKWDQLLPFANRASAQMTAQRQAENLAGINTDEVQGYVKHAYDLDRGILFDSGGAGIASSFKKQRTYATYAEAIADGLKPKKLDAADLIESRLAAGMKMINRVEWGKALGTMTDPSSGKPIAAPMNVQPKGTRVAPWGYAPREILPGIQVAIKDEYTGLFDAMLGPSAIRQSIVGRALLASEGIAKHGILLFDTFHAVRVGFNQSMLMGKLPSYTKGLSLLENNDPALSSMVRRGEITPDMYQWVQKNRPVADLLVKNGLNVGRLAEALNSSVIRKELPALGLKNVNFIGAFNKWVFEKMTRGAMLETGLVEFERTKQANKSWSDEQVAAHVSKQLNIYYGNLMRQGMFKSATSRDALQIAFLAPQWVESMLQKEVRAYKQLGQVPLDAAMQKTLKVGTLAKGVSTGVLFFVIANQIVNQYTRGKYTWQNDEDNHKFDAYLPIGKGMWISPLSTSADMTHEVIKLANANEDKTRVLGQIIQNKLSPLGRAEETLRVGRDYMGRKLLTTSDVLKETAKALIPTPIPVSGLLGNKDETQWKRSLLSSVGLKTDLAESSTVDAEAFKKQFNKPIEQGTLHERVAFQKAKERKPISAVEKASSIERAVEHEVSVQRDLEGSLKPETQAWITQQGLKIPGFKDSLHTEGVDVHLTPKEQAHYMKAMEEAYEQLIQKAKPAVERTADPKVKQAILDGFLKAARAVTKAKMGLAVGTSKAVQ